MSTQEEGGGPASALGLLALGALAAVLWSVFTQPRSILLILAICLAPFVLLAWAFPSLRGPMLDTARSAGGRAASMTAGSTRVARAPSSHYVEIRRFRLVDHAGQAHDCVLEGEIVGATIKAGDDIEVWGRRHRNHVVHVRKLRIVATAATVTGRVSARVRLLRLNRWMVRMIVVAIVVAVAVAVLR